MVIDKDKRTIVVYHDECVDGFASAYVCSKYFTNVEYSPELYTRDRKSVREWKADGFEQIVYVDITPIDSDLIQFVENCYVIDHHIGRLPILNMAHPSWNIYFDKDRSGVTSTYFALYGKNNYSNMQLYVEDYDLWKFELSNSKAINAYIGMQERSFVAFEKLELTLATSSNDLAFKLIVSIGNYIIRTNNELVEKSIRLSSFEKLGIIFVNSSNSANEIAETFDGDVCVYYHKDDRNIRCSFRGPNALFYAKQLGGNGHELSAGAYCEELPWLLLKQWDSSPLIIGAV